VSPLFTQEEAVTEITGNAGLQFTPKKSVSNTNPHTGKLEKREDANGDRRV
jgi:hypothetical protein